MAFEELTSIEIHSVADAIAFVKSNATRIYDTNVHSISLYRGQSDYNWRLTPAVYRNGQFKYESIYIKELERIRPSEFANCDNFDKLVKIYCHSHVISAITVLMTWHFFVPILLLTECLP